MGDAGSLINALHPSVVNRLDPQFADIYNRYQAPRIRADQVTYEEYNGNRSEYTFPICQGPLLSVGTVKIYKVPVSAPIGEIDVEVFFPTKEATPLMVLKPKTSDESWCRQACQALGCIIINVDYRLPPEFPHPVPLTDSWVALKWVFASANELGIDVERVSIGGLSAGGQLAAVLALLARDEPGMPKLVLQLLIVPCIDARFIPLEGPCDAKNTPYESLIKNEFAKCLPLNRLRWFYNLWLGSDIEKRKKMGEHFWASPILASSHANLAPASFHVAGVDTLTSEGIAYHEVLTKAGTPSKLKVYEGCGHPFGVWDGELVKAKEFVQDTFVALREAYKEI